MSDSPRRTTLRLGTRGSLLARAQSRMIADEIERDHLQIAVELIIRTTTGDRIQDRPLHEAGGKGLFVKELELTLLAGEIDFAVHSFKDVPVTMPLVDQSDLLIAAVPVREDPRDVLVCATAKRLADLPQGARVGTGSMRRKAQLLNARPDLQVVDVRGNIDTRIRKCLAGDYTAAVLAMAGVRRSGLFDQEFMTAIETEEMIPAAAQGALALQCRADDSATGQLLASLNDPDTARCVAAERLVVELLQGDCNSPISAFARIEQGQMILRVMVAKAGGHLPVIFASASGADDRLLITAVMEHLTQQGAQRLLHP
jgi:hydroxymethylbilane synthase